MKIRTWVLGHGPIGPGVPCPESYLFFFLVSMSSLNYLSTILVGRFASLIMSVVQFRQLSQMVSELKEQQEKHDEFICKLANAIRSYKEKTNQRIADLETALARDQQLIKKLMNKNKE